MNQTSYTCPWCGYQSFNPSDILYRWCGHCHAFSERGDHWLVCSAREPKLASLQAGCTLCGHKVWQAASSPEGYQPICLACFRRIVDTQDPDTLEILDASPAQLADIAAYRRRLSN